MPKYTVRGNNWRGWEVFVNPRNVQDNYQAFARKIVPQWRSDDPTDTAMSRGKRQLISTKGRMDLLAVDPTIKIGIDHEQMSRKLDAFYGSREKKDGPKTDNVDDILDASFVLGELSHADIAPKRFLIENMMTLKEMGFETLFLEHLYFDNQADLDNFNNSPTGEMSELLTDQLETLEDGHMLDNAKEGYNYTQILRAAHAAKIRVVATDTAATYCAQRSKNSVLQKGDDPTREKHFSYTACNIIEADAHQGKWIALMGAAHVSSHNNVPGVGELLGVRRVIIGDTQNAPYVSFNDKVLPYGIETDVLMKLDPKQEATLQALATKPATDNLGDIDNSLRGLADANDDGDPRPPAPMSKAAVNKQEFQSMHAAARDASDMRSAASEDSDASDSETYKP